MAKNKWSPIGHNIKTLREYRKIHPKTMAEKLSLTLRAYQNIENGLTDLSHTRLEEIAKILDVSVVTLETVHERPIYNITNEPHDNGVAIGHNQGTVSPENGAYEMYIKDLKAANAELLKQNEDLRGINTELLKQNEGLKVLNAEIIRQNGDLKVLISKIQEDFSVIAQIIKSQ